MQVQVSQPPRRHQTGLYSVSPHTLEPADEKSVAALTLQLWRASPDVQNRSRLARGFAGVWPPVGCD